MKPPTFAIIFNAQFMMPCFPPFPSEKNFIDMCHPVICHPMICQPVISLKSLVPLHFVVTIHTPTHDVVFPPFPTEKGHFFSFKLCCFSPYPFTVIQLALKRGNAALIVERDIQHN